MLPNNASRTATVLTVLIMFFLLKISNSQSRQDHSVRFWNTNK